MPNVEIDELQLAKLTQYETYLQKGLANPKTRRKLLEVQKEIYPDQAIPEIDESNPLRDELKAMREEMAADRKAREEASAKDAEDKAKQKIESDWIAGRKKLADARYPEEAIPEIEKLMRERSIFDHEAAAALYDRLNPPPDPVLSGNSRMGWFDMPADAPDIKMLMNKDYDGFLAQAIPAARREYRQGRQ